MQLNRLLECGSFVHHVFILDRYHSIVHIRSEVRLFGLLLVVEPWVSSAKWVHLVALVYLEAECAQLILH